MEFLYLKDNLNIFKVLPSTKNWYSGGEIYGSEMHRLYVIEGVKHKHSQKFLLLQFLLFMFFLQ